MESCRSDCSGKTVIDQPSLMRCPNCGFANLALNDCGELVCPVCSYGATRRHT